MTKRTIIFILLLTSWFTGISAYAAKTALQGEDITLTFSSKNVEKCGQVETPPGYRSSPAPFANQSGTIVYTAGGSGSFSLTCTNSRGVSTTAIETLTVLVPSGTVTGGDCVIPDGSTSCTVNIGWTTNVGSSNNPIVTLAWPETVSKNFTEPNSPPGGYPYTLSQNIDVNVSISYQPINSYKRLLDSKTLHGVCKSDSTFINGVCTPITASLVVPSTCEIALNNRSCYVKASRTSFLVSGSFSLWKDGVWADNIYSDSFSNPITISAPGAAPTVLELRYRDTTYDTKTVSSVCVVGTTWDGKKCKSINGPDLVAGSVSPTTATSGKSTSFITTITNAGGDSTGTSFSDFMQSATTNPDTDPSADITDYSGSLHSALASGSTFTYSKSLTFATPGTYYLRTCADKSSSTDTGKIPEANENNNCGPWTPVTIIDKNYIVITAASPVSSQQGQAVTLTYSTEASSYTQCALYNFDNSTRLTATTSNSATKTTTVPNATTLSRGSYLYNVQCNLMLVPSKKASAPITLTIIKGTPSGTLTLSPNSCSISAGASTCTVNATWATSNTSSLGLWNKDTGANLSSVDSSASPLPVTVANPQTTFELKDGSTVLSTQTATAACTPGTTWNGSTCQLPTPAGSLSLSPSSCSISAGASTCTVYATWTTSNVGGPGLWNKNTSTKLSSAASNASPLAVTVAYSASATIFELRNYGTVLSTRAATAACTPGTTWNGSTCQLPTPAGSLSLSPSSCSISAGASTCTVYATWTTSNVTSPGLWNRNTGANLSSAANNPSPLPVTVANPQTTFELKNGSTVLSTQTASASCIPGTTWNGSTCQLPAQIKSFTADPRTAKTNGATTLTWDIQNPPQGASKCIFSASPVCTGGTCTSPRDTARTAAASSLTALLASGTTDTNDPYGSSRSITNALTLPTTRAQGRKTITIQYTTDFMLTCGASTQKIRVQIASDNEG